MDMESYNIFFLLRIYSRALQVICAFDVVYFSTARLMAGRTRSKRAEGWENGKKRTAIVSRR